MANSLTVQTLEEGLRNLSVRVVGILDTSNVAITDLLDPATYNCSGTQFTPTTFRVDRIDYSISDQLTVQLCWDATADVFFAALAGRGDFCYREFGGLQNNAGAGKTGKVQIQTTGWTSGTQTFDLTLALVKMGG